MADKYAITGGGNWTGSTWNTASNQATSNTTAPTNADTAILNQYSGQVTVNATTAVCKVLNMSGYANTLTFTSGQILTVGGSGSGTVTLGGTIAGTGTLALPSQTTTITSNGVIMTGSFSIAGGALTLTGDFQVNGTFTFAQNTNTIAGNNLKINGGVVIGTKGVLGGTGTVEFIGSTTLPALSLGCNVILNTGAYTLVMGASFAVAKTLTYTSGTINQTTNSTVWSLGTGSTINTDGLTLRSVTCGGTITFGTDFQANLFNPVTATYVGAYTLTITTYRIGSTTTTSYTSGGTWIHATGMTLNVTDQLQIAGNYPFVQTISSSSASTPTTWKFDGSMDDCCVGDCVFTDIDASSGNRIHAINSTVLRSPNIVQVRNSDLYGVGVALKTINRKRTFYV